MCQQYSVYPIIWAAGRGHADIVQLLLQNGAKVNCSDKVGQQPSGSAHVVSLSVCKTGFTPSHEAARTWEEITEYASR